MASCISQPQPVSLVKMDCSCCLCHWTRAAVSSTGPYGKSTAPLDCWEYKVGQGTSLGANRIAQAFCLVRPSDLPPPGDPEICGSPGAHPHCVVQDPMLLVTTALCSKTSCVNVSPSCCCRHAPADPGQSAAGGLGDGGAGVLLARARAADGPNSEAAVELCQEMAEELCSECACWLFVPPIC